MDLEEFKRRKRAGQLPKIPNMGMDTWDWIDVATIVAACYGVAIIAIDWGWL